MQKNLNRWMSLALLGALTSCLHGCLQELQGNSTLFPLQCSNKKTGFIDKSGKFVINPQFDYNADFYEGLARVGIGSKWGFIDKSGKFVINPQFDDAADFYEGLATVNVGDKWGFSDKSGKIISPDC